jgi:AcrR family transcriptional regulator
MLADERRALILEVACELFGSRPYAAVSVSDIARAAEVSPPLVVFHYGSKWILYCAVIEASADAIRQGLAKLPGPPSLDRLHAGVRFYAGYACSHRAGFLSLLRGGQESGEAAAIVESLRQEVAAQILADLQAATSADGVSAEGEGGPLTPVAIRGYLGYVDAAIVEWISLPEDQRDRVTADQIADLAAAAFRGSVSVITSSTPPRTPAAEDRAGS